LKKIRRYQRFIDLLLSKRFFTRVMKEVFRKIRKSHLQIQSAALIALQEATKAALITNFAGERTRESFHC
jgi:histone H3/H4